MFFEIALRAVLINWSINPLIQINSEPNILRSCFLHWLWGPLQWIKQLLRIFGPELTNELQPREARFQKIWRGAIFFWRRQPRIFENMTLVARRREYFRIFLAIVLVAQLSPKRGVLVQKNSLNYTTIHLGLWSAEYGKNSVRLQVGLAQVSTHICWWLINRATQT